MCGKESFSNLNESVQEVTFVESSKILVNGKQYNYPNNTWRS